MPEKRKAAVFYGVDDLRIESLGVPEIGPDEVLIENKAVGVCGSDVHFYKEGNIGPLVPEPGHILGHECAGKIVETGENVDDSMLGKRVAVEPGTPCGQCEFCKKGKYNLCPDMSFMGHPDPFREGALVEYFPQSAAFTYELADHVSYKEGAMAEPLSVAMQAIKQGNLKPGDTVAILGSGPIGICLLLAAKAAGAAKVFNTDVMDYRLDFAKQFGAEDVYNPEEEDVVDNIMDATDGRGVDLVIDAAATSETYEQSTALAVRGGTIVFVGMASKTHFPINTFEIGDKELTIASVFRYANVYDRAVKLINDGSVPIKKIITHEYDIENVAEAMDLAHDRRDDVIKAVVTF